MNVKAINLNWVRAGERKIYWRSEAKLAFVLLPPKKRTEKLINYLVFLFVRACMDGWLSFMNFISGPSIRGVYESDVEKCV